MRYDSHLPILRELATTKYLVIGGTRPNYVKISPLLKELKNYKLVHTGQHYDNDMINNHFKDLKIKPDIILERKDKLDLVDELKDIIKKEKPEMVLVFGDVDSTFAGALAANETGTKLAHIESGLRCFQDIPEEVNRKYIDSVADYLFVTEQSGVDNLEIEKVNGKIFYVGNTMIDTLKDNFDKISKNNGMSDYGVVTLHRQSNVDNKEMLSKMLSGLGNIKENLIWTIHPRTKKRIEEFGLTIPNKYDWSLVLSKEQ